MSALDIRLSSLAGGALLAVLVALPALADDTEIYRSQLPAAARPNVLFILDTSGSMDSTVVATAPLYDPNTDYDGACVDSLDRIYFSTSDTPPTCATSNWFPRASNTCKASHAALVNLGGSGVWPAGGNPRAKAAQLDDDEWEAINQGRSWWVECAADNGVHGRDDASAALWARDSSSGWTTSSRNVWGNLPTTYRFYTANYLNYLHGPGRPIAMTRLQIVRDVAINLAGSLQNVNLGLMRYSSNASGGYVLHPVQDIATSRASIIGTLNGFTPTAGSGGTPLSETYYEAVQYLRGGAVDFGSNSVPGTSVDGSRVVAGGSQYRSPIANQCQKNYIVYLTDGAPTVDDEANARIATMIGRSCAADPVPSAQDPGWTPASGICMDDLAAWLRTADLADDHAGDQSALTYMVGFGNSLAGSVGYLNTIAAAGGTERAYTAGDVPTLTSALQQIFASIQESSGTFITPSISVNTFNRAQTSSDLFFSLFKVESGAHWPGNLKKYVLDGTVIVDVNGNNAVNAAGVFDGNARSYWSPTRDGNEVTLGGAASVMPAPAARKLYTWFGPTMLLSDPLNALSTTNTRITELALGAGTAATCAAGSACETSVKWLRGHDVKDLDRDGDRDEARHFMGDPLHGRSAAVAYGGTPADKDPADVVVFVPTNDGFLHAISGATGAELWAFMPPELLPRVGSLYENAPAAARTYGLDGDVRVLKLDKNQDGVVDASAGDRVWLFFGMRMGGSQYYGVDVTDRTRPTLLWNIGPTELPGVGQTWSAPVVTRVRVGAGGAENDDPERFVLVFGGGYDMGQEVQPYSNDDVGNRIFMVDAATGDRLWFAGPAGAAVSPAPDLQLADMTNAIPGRITALDTDGDGFSDRMYAVDLGGRLWRFDITNGNPRSTLVAGGVLALLGAGDTAGGANSAAASDPGAARRFYNAPDVSLVQRRGQDPYYNIALGSGHRGHPLDEATADRFYSIRDKQPYARLDSTAYASLDPILDSELVDITASPTATRVAASDPGWRFSVSGRAGRTGEKVLSEATTVNNVILFTTFQPLDPPADDPCFPANVNRVYALTVDGKPGLDLQDDPNDPNDDGVIDDDDISQDLEQTGIVGEVNVALVRAGGGGGPGAPTTVCVAGVEVLRRCVDAGGTIRTYWQRNDAP
jgi:type IV pilus assembly protein PilY1